MSAITEFSMCVLGCTTVGKTSLMNRLVGVPFNRKSSCRSSMEETATKYSIEVPTSAGLVLFHFFDWAWEQKRKDQSINQELMRGSNGALYVFDVTDRRTLSDFAEYSDWYARAAGFDKPWVIISNKNDQKKRAIQETEGPALARKGDHRAYAAISLADDTGLDDLVLSAAKLMMKDVNLTVTGAFRPASEASMAWSNDRATAATAGIGLGMPVVKSKSVLLVVLNKSVVEKFNDMLVPTVYALEVLGSIDQCEEALIASGAAEDAAAGVASGDVPLPVAAILVPPTATESQKSGLTALASKYGVGFLVSPPRNVLEGLEGINKK